MRECPWSGGVLGLVVGALTIGALCVGRALADQPAEALTGKQVLEAAGVRGGLVVHLGCGGGRLAAELWAGDVAVVSSENKQVGLAAYRLSPAGAEKLWTFPELLNAASPLVIGGCVYACAGGEMACVESA